MTDKQAADLDRASMMLELGRPGDAARLLAGVLATAPESSRGWCLLSRAHLGNDQPAEAVAAAARASALDPADDWPYRLASAALVALGQPANAVAAALEARKLGPHFWRSHICLAQAAAADGQLELAAEAAAAALALASDEADVHVTAGKVALEQGDLAEARRRQEAALAIDPMHSGALNELGRISLRSRDAAGAVGRFLTAARSSPGNGVFGRNIELALSRIALSIAASVTLLLIGAVCLLLVALTGKVSPLLAVQLPMPALVVAAQAAAQIRRLPPEGRRRLPGLLWARRTQLLRELAVVTVGRAVKAALRHRKPHNRQDGNVAARAHAVRSDAAAHGRPAGGRAAGS